MRIPVLRILFALAVSVTALVATASADTFTITSSTSGYTPFVNDNDISAAIPVVTVDPFTQIDLLTTSYAAGGFDLTVAVFDNDSGNLLGQSLDIDGGNGLYDDVLSVVVPAGNYSLFVTQYDNIAQGPTFVDGFLLQGAGNEHYTDPAYGGSGGAFTDLPGNVRNNTWSVSVSRVAIPEAPSALLVLPGLLTLTSVAVRRRNSVKGN